MKRTLFLLIALIVGGVSPLLAQSLIGKWQVVSTDESEEDIPIWLTLTFESNNCVTFNIDMILKMEEIGTLYNTFSYKGVYEYDAPNCSFYFDLEKPKYDFHMHYDEVFKARLAENPNLEEMISNIIRENIEKELKKLGEDICSTLNDMPHIVKNLTSDSFDLIGEEENHFVRVKAVR